MTKITFGQWCWETKNDIKQYFNGYRRVPGTPKGATGRVYEPRPGHEQSGISTISGIAGRHRYGAKCVATLDMKIIRKDGTVEYVKGVPTDVVVLNEGDKILSPNPQKEN